MSAEQQFRSTRELFAAVRESADRGEKRDYRADSSKLLELERVDYETRFINEVLPPEPLVVASNHYVPSLLTRRSIFTTKAVYNASSVVTLGLQNATDRKITWFIKGDMSEKLLWMTLKDRQTQAALVKCYDLIPVTENNSRETFQLAQLALSQGINLGIYPEGEPPCRELRDPHRGFIGLIVSLQRARVNFSVLPASIYYEGGKYHTTFDEAISSQDRARDIAQQTMQAIASNLPSHLRGIHRKSL